VSNTVSHNDALTAHGSQIHEEQQHLSILYHHLDDLRERASARLRDSLAEVSTNQQARSQRDATSAMYADLIAQYNAVENGLCFGRLDFTGAPDTFGAANHGVTRYIGRIGIHDAESADEPLLTDWRAPGARPFYLATVASPDGVARRRHLQTSLRRVTGIEDEAFDVDVLAKDVDDTNVTSEAALLHALSADRTGRMADIVETIQAEQDEIIRAEHTGVLVVEGGPGTGKTAVALHRAAYLLYHHRDTLAKRGVLLIGPNPTFLRYIGRVLPGLGETAVVLSTIGDLLPGVRATRAEPDSTAEIKGRPEMVEVIASAISDRERVPDEPWEIDFDRDVLTVEPDTCESARQRARASRLPHNAARPIFVREMVIALAQQAADKVGADVFGGPTLLTTADIAVIEQDLCESATVREALDELWPDLTPQQLLADLYADPLRLELAAPDMSKEDRTRLRRDDNDTWSAADVALLDEAADLLGVDDSEEQARAEAEVDRERVYAEGVLSILSRDIDDDPEILMAHDLIDAERLAGRQADSDGLSVAERAAADRQWAYGHIIVDEAQELSAMAWRMVMRRCPSRSMTLVGDVAQTSEPGGTASWADALAPFVAQRWRLDRLTVNYRTPAEIMAIAETVLRRIDPTLEAPRSIRSAADMPWRLRIPDDQIASSVRDAVRRERDRLGDGRLAVLVPAQCLASVRAAMPELDGADLTDPVVILTVREAKGLEFDAILIVEPRLLRDGSARGANDLYVALTRATKRLGVLHTGHVPDELRAIPVARALIGPLPDVMNQ
jgi:DNA helicase IV